MGEREGSAGAVGVEALAARLHSAAIHLLRRARAADRESGLSPARLSALSVLVFGGARTLGELAAAEQVTPPSMSRLVSGLEGTGLVSREPDPDDGRAVRIVATERGRRLLEEGRARRIRVLSGLLRSLEADQRALLSRAVTLLEAELESSRES